MKNTPLDKFVRLLRIREVIALVPQDSVLCDFGCDEGHFLRAVKSRIKRGYGFDRRADEHKEGNLIFRRVDLNCSLPKVSADCVTLLAVLEHMDNPEIVLKNARNLLKRGGKIIITTPTPLLEPFLKVLALLKLIDENEIKDHKNYFTKKQMITLLNKCGFKHVKIKRFEFGFNMLTVATK